MTLRGYAFPVESSAKPVAPAGRFERAVLPLLSAAYTLAMYLMRNSADAEDAVQEAVLRAVRYLPTLLDENARAWFLTIVRRVCWNVLSGHRAHGAETVSIDAVPLQLVDDTETADISVERTQTQQRVRDAIDQLPMLLRETIVLRELQSLSYAEIATITEVPVGTVMSRISRGRARLAELLSDVVDFGDAT
jgi:RNA polymerase sigma factor (sigma-70 family)